MPSAQIPRGLIDKLIGEGADPEESFRGYRKLGGNISSDIWQRVWGEVENELSLGAIETGKPLNRVPQAEDILPMTTKRATGYLQQVQVIMTEADGNALTKTFSISTKQLVSRANAIRKAMQIMEEANESGSSKERYPEREVKLAIYGGTYEMNPY
jgi:hypothetical protein